MSNIKDFDGTSGNYELCIDCEATDSTYSIELEYKEGECKFYGTVDTYEYNALTETGVRVYLDPDYTVSDCNGRGLIIHFYTYKIDIENYIDTIS